MKSLLTALLFVSACASAAAGPKPRSSSPTFPVTNLQSIPLAQPLFYKGVYTSRSTGEQRVYYGLANRIVLVRVNDQTPPPLPEGYIPAFSGFKKVVYLSDVQRFDFDRPDHPFQARVTLKSGEAVTVESLNDDVRTPNYSCAPNQEKVLRTNCQTTYLAGALLDDARGESFTDTSLYLHQGFQTLEFIEGPQAVAAFKAAKAEFDQHRKAEQEALAAEERAAKAWRAGLNEGSATNCGMVIERKKDIANIQMDNGARWIRLDNLSPVGTQGVCN